MTRIKHIALRTYMKPGEEDGSHLVAVVAGRGGDRLFETFSDMAPGEWKEIAAPAAPAKRSRRAAPTTSKK